MRIKNHVQRTQTCYKNLKLETLNTKFEKLKRVVTKTKIVGISFEEEDASKTINYMVFEKTLLRKVIFQSIIYVSIFL